MSKLDEQHIKPEELSKEHKVAAIIAAMVQHGTIAMKRPKQKYVKKESEWKKRRTSGLR